MGRGRHGGRSGWVEFGRYLVRSRSRSSRPLKHEVVRPWWRNVKFTFRDDVEKILGGWKFVFNWPPPPSLPVVVVVVVKIFYPRKKGYKYQLNSSKLMILHNLCDLHKKSFNLRTTRDF